MILVTGGAGYVGAVLVRRLLEAGYQVRVLDKLYFGPKPLEEVRDRIELRQKDVRLADEEDLEGIAAVVHLAAFSNDPTAEFWPALTRRVNSLGTRHLAALCVEHGVDRFVLASTAAIYDRGDEADPMALDEDCAVAPTATYAVSKLLAEREVLRLRAQHPAFCPVILRKGTVYGWSPRMRYDLVVNTMVTTALRDGVITVHGDGTIWRPLVSVTDAAEAYLLALRAPAEQVAGQVFNVVERNYQLKEIAAAVWFAAGRAVMMRFAPAPQKLRNYRVTGDRARQVLGFVPKVDVGTAAQELATWFDKAPLAEILGINRVRGTNIEWMTHLIELEEELRTMRGVF